VSHIGDDLEGRVRDCVGDGPSGTTIHPVSTSAQHEGAAL
jgi:hypothetical protein